MNKSEEPLLTADEAAVIEQAGKVFSMFTKLPVMHCCDAEEVCHAVHTIQYIVMKRPIQRNDPYNYPIYTESNPAKI